jgi:hypothetical protein
MTADRPASGIDQSVGQHNVDARRRVRFAETISGSSAAMGISGLAMVALVERSPWLAARAARVILEDSYATRVSSRRERGHRLSGRVSGH